MRWIFGAPVGGVLFFRHELSTEHPAVDLRVLRHPALDAGSLFRFCSGMGLHAIVFPIPVFVQVFLNSTLIQSGYLLMPGGIASAFAAIYIGENYSAF